VGGTDTLPRGNADYVGPTDIIIIPHFDESVKSFSTTNPYAVYIPQAKAWGFDGGVLKLWLTGLTTLILLPLIFPSLKQAWQRWVKKGSTNGGHSSSLREIRDFAASSGFSGTPRSENRDSAEGS